MALLFVAGSSGGTLAPVAGTTDQFELQMTGVEPNVTWFSDRPVRRAGRESLRAFLDHWAGFGFANEPPNAALEVQHGSDVSDTGTKVVELSRPRYDEAAATLSFRAHELADGPRERLEFVKDELGHPFPDAFKAVNLFIDDADVPAAISPSGSLQAASPEPVVYATFSGESSKGSKNNPITPINRVVGFNADGSSFNVTPDDKSLSELRGMAIGADGSLYVANSHKSDTRILLYGPPKSDATRDYVGNYAEHDSSDPGVYHPYGLAFDPSANLLVSSQDTCVVTRLSGTVEGAPAPLGSWLPPPSSGPAYFPGTLVAESTAATSTDCPSAGAQVSAGVQWPRGIAVGNGMLYVADNPAGVVRVYDVSTGQPNGVLAPVADPGNPPNPPPAPVGVYLSGTTLFVSSEGTDDVWVFDTTTGKGSEIIATKATSAPAWDLPKGVSDITLDAPSGLTCGSDGALYVNNRKAQQILRYDLASHSASVFADKLTDTPEQIIAVASSPPTCRTPSS
jgi:hypothetical protein